MSMHQSEAQILRFPAHEAAAPSKTGLTAGDVIREYLADLAQQRDAGDVTADHYDNVARSLQHAPPESGYKGFADHVGHRAIAELRQLDLQGWLRDNPRWKSDETKKRNLSAVLACFHWAAGEGELIECCPYRKTRREKKLRQVERRDASDAEYSAICGAASEHLRQVVEFIDETGARTCEARLARWTDVSWEDRAVVLDDHKTADQVEEPEPRLIPLSQGFVKTLGKWRVDRRKSRSDFSNADDGRVLVNAKGTPWTRRALCLAFRRLRDKLKLAKDLSLYCFRHRFGTRASKAGLTDREVADLMGHRDPRTTRRYTHTKKRQHLASVADKLATRLAAGCGPEAELQLPAT